MGLCVSHGCWSGPYSQFMAWRTKVAEVAGFGNIKEYEGFSQNHQDNPHLSIIGTRVWPDEPLAALLSHSDCVIPWMDCAKIADALGHQIPSLARADVVAGSYGDGHAGAARRFVAGLRKAHKLGEDVKFQ